ISPTKLELVTDWLDGAGLGAGPVEMIGGYRFDDPAGEVGVEGLLARRGDQVFHLPLTYRAAPLPGAEEALVCTMDHSTLGKRWIHHAAADPVAVACFTRALAGEQEQAELEVHRADGTVDHLEPPVRVRRAGARLAGELRLTTDLGMPV